eukprot:gb/GECG01000362.1/.p1 GENE.gb/GECG01000362.1/~~gb/GECG01000362.1/.p1  ORF type:complete len:108 (+),score=7.52 gb/GECG01000362.1/:1-324(+)
MLLEGLELVKMKFVFFLLWCGISSGQLFIKGGAPPLFALVIVAHGMEMESKRVHTAADILVPSDVFVSLGLPFEDNPWHRACVSGQVWSRTWWCDPFIHCYSNVTPR